MLLLSRPALARSSETLDATSLVITLTGNRAGFQLAQRHNNFLPLFKSPVSLAPPLARQPRGEGGWPVRAQDPGMPLHVGSWAMSRSHEGCSWVAAHEGPGWRLGHRAEHRAFPGSAPSPQLSPDQRPAVLAGPRMTRDRDAVSGWRQPRHPLPPVPANSAQR